MTLKMFLVLCFRVNVSLKVQLKQFTNGTNQVLRKRRDTALANGCHSVWPTQSP